MFNKHDKISVLMLGGKRCGKTTTLAAMYDKAKNAIAGTEFSLIYDKGNTEAELNNALEEIKNVMKTFSGALASSEVSENNTGSFGEYHFRLVRNSTGNVKNGGIPFVVYDIPGEWIEKEQEKLKRYISECQVIIIAIDTPRLFAKRTDDNYGRYHEEANKSIQIADFFRQVLSPEDIRNRMILFVPIKCERYFHLDRLEKLNKFGRSYMSEVSDTVIAGYSNLLFYLRSHPNLLNNTTIAITPIMSAGGIDFIGFKEKDGEMVSYYQAPEYIHYENDDERYSPEYCEQPMIYVMAYILANAIENTEDTKDIFSFVKILSKGMTRQQMEMALNTLRTKMLRDDTSKGYKMIQNPKNL